MKINGGLSPMCTLMMAVMLGIVARTVKPELSVAAKEQRICDLAEALQTMRAHLDLYRAHHKGSLPPTSSFRSFENALTTERAHYDPHLKKIPVNPFNGLAEVRFDGEPAGTGKAGWRLDTQTALFQADNSLEHAVL
jgi:hypothetical protein